MTLVRVLFRCLAIPALALSAVAGAQVTAMSQVNRVLDIHFDSYKDCISENTLWYAEKWKREICRSSLYTFATELEKANQEVHSWLNYPGVSAEDNSRLRNVYNTNLEMIETARKMARRYN